MKDEKTKWCKNCCRDTTHTEEAQVEHCIECGEPVLKSVPSGGLKATDNLFAFNCEGAKKRK